MCTGHGLPCALLVVKNKKKGNFGRKFYGCSVGSKRNGGCGFFMWARDYDLKSATAALEGPKSVASPVKRAPAR